MGDNKMANFGGSVDIAARMKGSSDALKDLGLPDVSQAGQTTRMGTKAVKPPKVKAVKGHKYTTSGATENPKVAFLNDAPNYGPASSPQTNCERCKHFDKKDSLMGHCADYDFYARNDHTCDSWKQK